MKAHGEKQGPSWSTSKPFTLLASVGVMLWLENRFLVPFVADPTPLPEEAIDRLFCVSVSFSLSCSTSCRYAFIMSIRCFRRRMSEGAVRERVRWVIWRRVFVSVMHSLACLIKDSACAVTGKYKNATNLQRRNKNWA